VVSSASRYVVTNRQFSRKPINKDENEPDASTESLHAIALPSGVYKDPQAIETAILCKVARNFKSRKLPADTSRQESEENPGKETCSLPISPQSTASLRDRGLRHEFFGRMTRNFGRARHQILVSDAKNWR
jgi:hypothetical protein